MAESNVAATKGLTQTVPNKGELLREKMLGWAKWSIANRAHFVYTEGPSRWHMMKSPAGSLPQSADCSAFVTGLAKWSGASDPNGLAYKGGYTGTLLTHCNHIARAQGRMGDLIVFGPGTGSHAVFIMERIFGDGGEDFWVASHGHQGDPGRYLFSQMDHYFHGVHQFLRWLS